MQILQTCTSLPWLLNNSVCSLAVIPHTTIMVPSHIYQVTATHWMGTGSLYGLQWLDLVMGHKASRSSTGHQGNMPYYYISLRGGCQQDGHVTHWGLLTPYGVLDHSHHWSRQWLPASSGTSHYLNQWRLIINYNLRSIFQWNFIWNSNTQENVIC